MLSPQAARAKSMLLRGPPRSAVDDFIEAGEVRLRGEVQRQDLLKIVKALRQNAALHTLEVEDANVGNEGVKGIAEALKANETLTHLSLCNASITGPGASHLADALKDNHTLKTLRLRSNKLGHIGMQRLAAALKQNSALQHVDLTDTGMDKNGAQHLSEALFENHGVKVIRLGSNPIGSEGAQAIANAIRANSTLTQIDLSNTDIEDDGLVSIIDALQITLSLQSVVFPSTLASSREALGRLEQMLVIPHPRSPILDMAGCDLSSLNLLLPPHIAAAGNRAIVRFLRQRARVYRAVTASLLRDRGFSLENLKLVHALVFGDGWERFSVDAGFVTASPRVIPQRLSRRL